MGDMKKKEKLEDWIRNNGGADFDTKEKNIILNDGGLFSIEKKTKVKPKTRIVVSKNPTNVTMNGKIQRVFPVFFKKIRINGKIVREKVESYSAVLWFEELDETINYLKRMKKMLNKLGYSTNYKRKK